MAKRVLILLGIIKYLLRKNRKVLLEVIPYLPYQRKCESFICDDYIFNQENWKMFLAIITGKLDSFT